MPTVSVGRDRLFEALGKTYTQKEFDELCFEFGIELDDVTTEKAIIRKEKHLQNEDNGDDGEEIYKIEVPANRYDFLCLEGIARALRTFIGKEKIPVYRCADIPVESTLKMHVKTETNLIRPFIACAVLRGITFNEASYSSFIDLQDKLHQNICRKRTLVAIGTHDLDTIQAPFSYEALPPSEINFVPLKQVTMFSEYCERKYEVEPVKVVYPDDRTSEIELPEDTHSQKDIYPDLSVTNFKAPVSEITGRVGLSLAATEVIPLLYKMQLQAEQSSVGENCYLSVSVPPTRSDILHACDLAEDVAIAFGYNNITKSKPETMTIGGRQPLSVFTDKIRLEVCKAGYMEVVTWILGSHEENFAMLRRENDSEKAVIIGNPRSSDFGVARTSLMAGLLKSLKGNIDHPRPIKIFEVGDVVTLDEEMDVGASNNRWLAALYCNVTSGFEVILGLVDRIMKVAPKVKVDDYKRPSDEPQFLPKRQCNIFLKERKIGSFGIIHPEAC